MTRLWEAAKRNRRVLCLAAALLAGWLLLSALGGGGGRESAPSDEEGRIAQVLSRIAGAGRVEVALFRETAQGGAYGTAQAQKPTGAVVVAEGAADWQVRINLIRAVRTLLSLPESAVDVFIMEATE